MESNSKIVKPRDLCLNVDNVTVDFLLEDRKKAHYAVRLAKWKELSFCSN